MNYCNPIELSIPTRIEQWQRNPSIVPGWILAGLVRDSPIGLIPNMLGSMIPELIIHQHKVVPQLVNAKLGFT